MLDEVLDDLGDRAVLVLTEVATPVERGLLDDALAATRPDVDVVHGAGGDLAGRLDDDDVAVVPVRVAWLPEPGERGRRARLRELLTLDHPRRPRVRTQARLVSSGADRHRVIVGEPATVGELRRRWRRETGGTGDAAAFARWVRRQGTYTLERAERAVAGERYKAPRHVTEEIVHEARFRDEVAALAADLDRPVDEVMAEAEAALDGVIATHSPLATDAFDALTGPLFRKAWDIDVDASSLDDLRALNREKGLVFLPAHRSYVDPLVLGSVLADAGFPRNHTPGGNNLDFWPFGSIARRAGVIFIPRTLRGDPVTKLALREYLGFLASKRFNLEWYMEAGRSRTGKLRPPRFGLLQFIVDALRSGRVDDVALVPVSITYDRLPEVGLMAAEEQGAAKQAEGVRWLARYARANSQALGTVHVRFGEPLSLRKGLEEAEGGGADPRLAMQKVGFEVFHRINAVTPITPMALVTLALLGVDGRALTEEEVRDVVAPFVGYVDRRGLPLTDRDAVVELGGVRRTLSRLQAAGIVSRYAAGAVPVFAIEPGQHHAAAFYRNSAIHWFVNRAIVELAMAREVADPSADPVKAAWATCLALRDLLKFEFFFSDKRTFYDELAEERRVLELDDDALPVTPEAGRAVLEGAGILAAPTVLRPFLEAYAVVSDRLAARDPREPIDEKAFVAECRDVGRQYLLQHRLRNPESVSPELFASALKLVANRDLYDPGREEVARRRRELADEIAGFLRALDAVEAVDRVRREAALERAGEG